MNKEEKQAIEKLQSFFWYWESIKDTEENINIILNLINKQEKVIDKMAESLEDNLFYFKQCENCKNNTMVNYNKLKCKNCIKEHFLRRYNK